MPFWTIRASVTGMCSGRLEARLAAGGGVQIYSMWTQKATNICTDRNLNHGKAMGVLLSLRLYAVGTGRWDP